MNTHKNFISHKYIYAYMQKILSFPALGFLYYFPIYCIIPTLLHLGWAQGFTAPDFCEKTSLCKVGMQVSILLPSSAEQCMQ